MESVITVKPKENYQLELKFSTGETKVFDAKVYLEKGVFKQLKMNPYLNRLMLRLIPYAGREI